MISLYLNYKISHYYSITIYCFKIKEVAIAIQFIVCIISLKRLFFFIQIFKDIFKHDFLVSILQN